jgi:NADH:ubiquinone oxidoreductase subunit 6 (subunit J)
MHLIPFRTAAITLLVLFGAVVVFHLVVLAGFIPTEMVWGGRLKNEEERTVGAFVSISFVLVFAALVLVRMGHIGRSMPALGKWGMWSVCALFALNTVGNLFALDLRETLIFTPITLISAVLAARVALGE